MKRFVPLLLLLVGVTVLVLLLQDRGPSPADTPPESDAPPSMERPRAGLRGSTARREGDDPSPEPRSTPAVGTPEETVTRRVVRGHVRARETGEPVFGATLWVAQADVASVHESRVQIVRSDGDGAFALEHGIEAPVRLCCRAEGYLPHVSTPAEGRADSDIWLERGLQIRGRVVDASGHPIADVRVEAWGRHGAEHRHRSRWRHGGARTPQHAWSTSNAQGEFTLRGLEHGSHRLLASKRGYVGTTWKTPLTAWPGSGREIVVQLSRLMALRIRAVDAKSGETVTQATVSLAAPPRALQHHPEEESRLLLPRLVRDADGVLRRVRFALFTFRTDPTDVTVVAGSPGYETKRVSATPGVFPGPIVSVPLRRTGSPFWVGRIALSFGTEQPTHSDRWRGSSEFHLDLRPLAGGPRLRVPFRQPHNEVAPIKIPHGTYEAEVRGAGPANAMWFPVAHVRRLVIDDRTPETLVLPARGASILLQVEAPEGHVVREYALRFQGPGVMGGLDTWLYRSGVEYTSRGALMLWSAPGKLQLSVHKFGFQPAKTTIDVPADGSETIERVILVAGQSLSAVTGERDD